VNNELSLVIIGYLVLVRRAYVFGLQRSADLQRVTINGYTHQLIDLRGAPLRLGSTVLRTGPHRKHLREVCSCRQSKAISEIDAAQSRILRDLNCSFRFSGVDSAQ
jgi:hypothetical protein